MKEGEIVICGSGQAGCVQWISGDTVQVLLRSGELWTGLAKLCRCPQDQADLDSAPIHVERPEPRRKRS